MKKVVVVYEPFGASIGAARICFERCFSSRRADAADFEFAGFTSPTQCLTFCRENLNRVACIGVDDAPNPDDELSPVEMVRQIRSLGYTGPMIASSSDMVEQVPLLVAGCDLFVRSSKGELMSVAARSIPM